jgi:tetratricopeptide (TPR) repeat protein
MLSDGDEEVRLYAASEIDRLEAEQQKQIHKLRKKLKTDPDNPDYRFELAKQYIEYARILLISPNLRSFFLNHAIDILSANLRYRKNDPAYLFYRGLAYKISGDKQNALKDLKKAVRTGKNYLPAFIELADVYFSVERFDYVKMIMSTISIKKQNIEEFHAQLFWQN